MTKAQSQVILDCPFCGRKPTFGLTKKTGCQMHGDPIQRVTLFCNNTKCEAKPFVTGGDRYSHGETGAFFKEGEKQARDLAIKYWNTRIQPPEVSEDDLTKYLDSVGVDAARYAACKVRANFLISRRVGGGE